MNPEKNSIDMMVLQDGIEDGMDRSHPLVHTGPIDIDCLMFLF